MLELSNLHHQIGMGPTVLSQALEFVISPDDRSPNWVPIQGW